MTNPHWPDDVVLRDWQRRAVDIYHAEDKKNFVADVCPGAGKTVYSLRVAFDLLTATRIRRVVVVVHTDHLRDHWIAQALRFGLRLLPDLPFKWGTEHGMVLTYQQIGTRMQSIRRLITKSQQVLVIFDEVHHIAEKAAWGNAVGKAFAEAFRRLLLTGTPFRHDESKISFVTYKHGRAVLDFRYSYQDALNDGVVSPIFFPVVSGKASWKRGDQEFHADLSDQAMGRGRADRLDTVIDASNKWLPQVIKDADKRLTQLRDAGHLNAGGLIICKDQEHARAVAALVQRLTKKPPTLAISDIGDSSERIEEFKTSMDRWLVAVRMISEGVDIPRLRVGLYATNVTTELFFRQVVGRFIRIVSGLEDQSGYLYIPHDPLIVQAARDIYAEREHVLRERELSSLIRDHKARRPPSMAEILEALSAEAISGDVIVGDETFTQDELALANKLKQSLGLWYLADEVVAKIVRAMQVSREQVSEG